jgi:hypothetical protein
MRHTEGKRPVNHRRLARWCADGSGVIQDVIEDKMVNKKTR